MYRVSLTVGALVLFSMRGLAAERTTAQRRWIAPRGTWTVRGAPEDPYFVHDACDDPVEMLLPASVSPGIERCRPDSVTLGVRARPCITGGVSFGISVLTADRHFVFLMAGDDRTLDTMRFLERTLNVTEVLHDTLIGLGRTIPLDTLRHRLSFVFGRDSVVVAYDGVRATAVAAPWGAERQMVVGPAAQHGEVEFGEFAVHAAPAVELPPISREAVIHLRFGSGLRSEGGSSPVAP